MTDNNKHLVRVGHEFAAAMSDDTPIITIAKMVTELASALDVQSARSDALAAELERKDKRIEELEDDARELIQFKDVMRCAADALNQGEPLNLESLFKGELASAMFAIMFAGEFTRSGAKNYLELLYEVPEFGELTVTIQKVEGKTPGQRIAELEARTVTVRLPERKGDSDGSSTSEFDYGWNASAAYRDEQWKTALTKAGINLTVEG